MEEKREYFWFVQYLRGGAALLVIWSHLAGWWLERYCPGSTLMKLWKDCLAEPLYIYQNGGHLGVLLLFLISGFLTAHSIRNEKRSTFLSKRIIRIVPTYVIAMFVTAILTGASIKLGIDIPLGTNSIKGKDFVLSFFLLNYIFDTPSVLGVTWTLIIEIAFYLLIVILLPLMKEKPFKGMLCCVMVVSLFIFLAPLSAINLRIANHVVYILYILIGYAFYAGIKKSITMGQCIVAVSTCAILYVIYYEYLYNGVLFSTKLPVIYTCIMAIIIFGGAMCLVEKPSKLMDFFGNISYPLYLFHLPVGCFILNICHKYSIPYGYSLPLAFAICFLISFFAWKYVEKPLQKKSKDWIKKIHDRLDNKN